MTHPIDGAMGFKLEVPPIHPVLYSISVNGMTEHHRAHHQHAEYAGHDCALSRWLSSGKLGWASEIACGWFAAIGLLAQ